MRLAKGFITGICSLCCLYTMTLNAQEGDQILDGIGETALTARYVLDEDLRDWSRNNLHGESQGGESAFVKDDVFGKVLSLNSGDDNFVKLPAKLLSPEESFTISGWIMVDQSGQSSSLIDFGKDNRSHFSIAVTKGDIWVQMQADNNQIRLEKQGIEPKAWHHFAVVYNIGTGEFKLFVDGKLGDSLTNAQINLNQVLKNSDQNYFYIGGSPKENKRTKGLKLHDFRVYRIALGEPQIIRIYKTALQGEAVVNEREEAEDNLPEYNSDTPQLFNAYLTGVKDVELTTKVGDLPRLPAYLEAVYSGGIQKHKVRVIWPAPENNHKVQQSGSYTVVGTIPGTEIQPKAFVRVKEESTIQTPERTIEPFKLSQVQLKKASDGEKTMFIKNRDKFINTLAKTNPDSFLYMFRDAFGVEQPEGAEPLGVWDSQETKLRGHATGHYLSAIAQAYAGSAYDADLQAVFAQKMKYMVETLYNLSKMSGQPKSAGGDFVSDPNKVPFGPGRSGYDSDLSTKGIRNDYWNWGEGYISAYPPDQFIMLENGATYGGQNNQIWAPYYTLHKILAGLLDVYEISGNEKALVVAKGMGDWVAARITQLSTPTLISMWNRYIAGEYGGMNEVMARLYRLGGSESYLEVAALFDNIKMFYGDARHSHGLAKNVDTFRGLHANQHIPQIVGAMEMYRDTEELDYFKIADNFWYKATHNYMYSIGGVAGARNPANAECFPAQPASLYENGFSSGGQNETCATYNMLKLTRKLFFFEPKAELMDYYERGLYNHILASVAEDSPANTYHVPLLPGSIKHFGNPDMKGFTCCNGTAIESSTKLQNSIYFKSRNNKSLYVNLFIPSSLQWTERGIEIDQLTSFPREDHTMLKIKGEGRFDLRIRVPGWATNGFYVKINGKEKNLKAQPGTYLSINRKWKDGDTVELRMPFEFRLEPIMDQQNIASLFYGPVLLAAQEESPRSQWRKLSFDAQDLGKSIKGDPSTLEFNYKGVEFKPFYQTYGRHSVYLDVSLD